MQLSPDKFGVDVLGLVRAGIEGLMHDGLVEESKKRGLMRGGSQGLLLDMGTVVGDCHRKAYARMLGAEPPRKDTEAWRRKQWMFESGHRNEDTWHRILTRSPWRGPILREEEFPIQWRIETDAGEGADGGGREDIILCYPDGVPGGVAATTPDGRHVRAAQLLELKQIMSLGTAIDVLFADGKPKLGHAVQAARYLLTSGMEHSQIWYTNPFDIAIPDWGFVTPKIPQPGECGAEFLGYSKAGKPTKISQAEVGYHLTWHAGILHYCRVGMESEGWIPTVITETGLDDFWHMTLDIPKFQDLGPRPKAIDLHGNKLYWSPCDYCEWQPICDSAGDDYEAWEREVKARIPNLGDLKKGE